MLVRAAEINYDYTNDRVSAVGNVQIYYAGTSLEADRVIYDQKTKRVHAEGNVRLTETNGRTTYGEIINLSGPDIYRTGTVQREVYTVRGSVRQGNSGGPLVNSNGEVLGVVFGAAVDDPDTGFVLTATEISDELARSFDAPVSVGTGDCIV